MNLSRQRKWKPMSKQTNYTKIMTWQEYKQSLVENMADLNYPLRKEVKRDRYVLNKEGLEQAINKAVKETMEQMSKEK